VVSRSAVPVLFLVRTGQPDRELCLQKGPSETAGQHEPHAIYLSSLFMAAVFSARDCAPMRNFSLPFTPVNTKFVLVCLELAVSGACVLSGVTLPSLSFCFSSLVPVIPTFFSLGAGLLRD